MAKGDQISAVRPHFWVTAGMEHHGIDIGDGTVIHFARCERLSKPPEDQHLVVRTNIKSFAKNGKVKNVNYEKLKGFWQNLHRSYNYQVELRNYLEAPERNDEEVVNYAIKFLGKGRGEYDIEKMNCEHFATFIKRGYKYSLQVMRYDDASDYDRSGGGIAAIFEAIRIGGALLLRTKGDFLYKASVYYASDIYYGEYYDQPLVLPPRWYKATDPNGLWNEITQEELPHPLICPLKEILATFVDKNGNEVSLDHAGNQTKGGWKPYTKKA